LPAAPGYAEDAGAPTAAPAATPRPPAALFPAAAAPSGGLTGADLLHAMSHDRGRQLQSAILVAAARRTVAAERSSAAATRLADKLSREILRLQSDGCPAGYAWSNGLARLPGAPPIPFPDLGRAGAAGAAD
jgi:hypothetical protein